jgi:carotenoid 1,2-hydratase
MNHIELPQRSGAYRWYYVDVTSGDFTAVFIFMVGSIFSARYSMALKKGGLPREHAAVNFALYEKGVRRLWVLTEYGDVRVSGDERTLHIGDSWLRYDNDGLRAEVRDRTTPFMLTRWGRPTQVELSLTQEGPSHDELRLVDGLDHFWRPIAARSRARVRVKHQDVDFEGPAYHDGNHGVVPLGFDLRGWEWARVHDAHATTITYRPWADVPPLRVAVSGTTASCVREAAAPPQTTRTTWGLRVPSSLRVPAAPVLIESSPFYARVEAHAPGAHALGEVADFARFHSPSVRWMANFRTRAGGAA